MQCIQIQSKQSTTLQEGMINPTNPFSYRIVGIFFQINSNLSLHSRYYAEVCYELTGPIFVSLRMQAIQLKKKILLLRQVVGNTVSDLTGPRLEPHISRSRYECFTARPAGNLTVFKQIKWDRLHIYRQKH